MRHENELLPASLSASRDVNAPEPFLSPALRATVVLGEHQLMNHIPIAGSAATDQMPAFRRSQCALVLARLRVISDSSLRRTLLPLTHLVA